MLFLSDLKQSQHEGEQERFILRVFSLPFSREGDQKRLVTLEGPV